MCELDRVTSTGLHLRKLNTLKWLLMLSFCSVPLDVVTALTELF